MAPPDIAPTRRNYLQTQKALERTQEGYDLLEQKRQILVLELMTQLEAARRVKDEVNTAMAAAHRALMDAAVRHGMAALARQSCGVSLGHGLRFRSRSVMGVPVPEIECQPEAPAVQFSLTGGPARGDQVLSRFLEALRAVAELARVENAVFRLAREIRRTQRRVNALEKIHIPHYKDTLDYIAAALEERQREEFIVLRKVKHKRRVAAGLEASSAGRGGPVEAQES